MEGKKPQPSLTVRTAFSSASRDSPRVGASLSWRWGRLRFSHKTHRHTFVSPRSPHCPVSRWWHLLNPTAFTRAGRLQAAGRAALGWERLCPAAQGSSLRAVTRWLCIPSLMLGYRLDLAANLQSGLRKNNFSPEKPNFAEIRLCNRISREQKTARGTSVYF